MTVAEISNLVSRRLSQRLASELADILADARARLVRREQRHNALMRGERSVKRIVVQAYRVPSYTVRKHERIITVKK